MQTDFVVQEITQFFGSIDNIDLYVHDFPKKILIVFAKYTSSKKA